MVKPREKVVLDCDVRSRDLSFRSVWRELKSQGWTSKRPPSRSLDGRYRHIRPGSSADGAEGVDYFLGENAVLKYYANMLRTRSRTPRPTNPGDAEIARAAQVVRETYGALIEGTVENHIATARTDPSPASPPVIVAAPETTVDAPTTPSRCRPPSRSARRALATTESQWQ